MTGKGDAIFASIVIAAVILAMACPAVAGDGRISGTVRESAGTLFGSQIPGDPIEGASVRANDGSCSTTTDSAGRYNLTVPSGNITLVVSAEGFCPKTSGPIKVIDDNNIVGHDFLLERPSGNLTGMVTDDDDGRPISMATVAYRSGGLFSPTAMTNSSGGFFLAGLPAGALNMTLTVLPPYKSFNFTAQIRAGQTTTMNFPLKAPGYISVNVKDRDGKPVPNATVALGRYCGTADANGLVLLEVSPGSYEMRVSAPGFRTVAQPVNISKGDLASFEATISALPSGKTAGMGWALGVLPLVLMAVVVAVVAGALCYMMMRRGTRPRASPAPPPSPGWSPAAPPPPSPGPVSGPPPPPQH